MKIILLVMLSFMWGVGWAERTYTEAEKESFMKLWNTAKSIALIGVDDPLDDAVVALMAAPQPVRVEDNAYVYLLGLKAETDDPYQAGLLVYQGLEEAAASPQGWTNTRVRPPELHTPEKRPECVSNWVNCHERALANPNEYVAKDQLLQLRQIYADLLGYPYFQQIPRSFAENTFMHLQYVRYVQDINHHDLLSQTELRDSVWLEQQVLTEHKSLRSWLYHANDSFTQMLLLRMLRQNLDLINYLTQQGWLRPAVVLQAVQPTTHTDGSIRRLLLAEAALDYRNLLSFNHNVVQPQAGTMVEGVLLRHVFTRIMSKPNMSINADFKHRIKPMLAFDQVRAHEAKDHAGLIQTERVNDAIRNRAGDIHQLFFGSGINFWMRLKFNHHDMHMKINLLRGLLIEGGAEQLIHQAEQGEDSYLNVYDHSVPVMLDQQICHQGLKDLSQPQTCLTIY